MHEYALNNELYITRDLYLRRIVTEPRYKGLKDLLLRVEKKKIHIVMNLIMTIYKQVVRSNEDADEEQRLLLGEQSLMSPKTCTFNNEVISNITCERYGCM